MKTSQWLWLAASALLIVGLIFGFAPVTADGYHCGSAFHESSGLAGQEFGDVLRGGDGENGCDSARGSRQPLAWTALALAFLAAGAAMIVTEPKHPSEQKPERRQS